MCTKAGTYTDGVCSDNSGGWPRSLLLWSAVVSVRTWLVKARQKRGWFPPIVLFNLIAMWNVTKSASLLLQLLKSPEALKRPCQRKYIRPSHWTLFNLSFKRTIILQPAFTFWSWFLLSSQIFSILLHLILCFVYNSFFAHYVKHFLTSFSELLHKWLLSLFFSTCT